MPSADIVQIGLISLVLAVGIANFVYSHVLDPKSDIVFDSQVSSYSSAVHERSEFIYELYFNANNRGDDNGFVTTASIERLEFFDEEGGETEILSGDELADAVYGADPLVILNKEMPEDEYEKGPILVGEGDVQEILVVLRIFSGEMIPMVRNYEKTRAVLEFSIVDSEQEYERVAESEVVRTRGLEPHWLDEDEFLTEE